MDLEWIADGLGQNLDAKHQAREQGLTLCRKAIRLSANSIRAIHRGEKQQGEGLLDQARLALDEAAAAMAEHPDIRHAGFYHDASKEYAEGRLTHAVIFNEPFPSNEEIRVDAPAYLNGLGEAVGEIRRHVLDLMRGGDLARSEQMLSTMDDIYHLLGSMDYPDGMTGGLRRTTDVARAIIERTRGDVTTTLIQQGLKDALDEARKDLG